MNRFLSSLLLIVLCLPTVRSGLTNDLLITEIMAINRGTLEDEDGETSDWLEIHNPRPDPVNLDGWYLTDDAGNLRKWRFPAVVLDGDGYLVVFASGKDRDPVGGELHLNFRLSGSGEYLALVRPDGLTPSHQFSPEFPSQKGGFSYGIGQDSEIEGILPNGAPVKALIPQNDALGNSWTGGNEPFDDSGWTSGASGVGYLVTSPGFAVRNILAAQSVGNLSAAEDVISNAGAQDAVFSENAEVINYVNTGGAGRFGEDNTFPGLVIGDNEEDFVTEATATITIPSAGNWTFGVNSDDGFGLDIEGQGEAFRIEFTGTRGTGDTIGVFNVPMAGAYNLRLAFFERGGGAALELFAAPGFHGSFNGNFRLVGDPVLGIGVESLPTGVGGPSAFGTLIGTDVEASMYALNASAYVRIPFDVADPFAYEAMTLRMKYDDGFVAYLNGVEVSRRNAPAVLAFDSAATIDRSSIQAVGYQNIDISEHLGLLQAGANVLALHGLNDEVDGGNFLVHAELAEITVISMAEGFFEDPTPGGANASLFTAFVEDTKFDPNRGFYDAPFDVSLTTATEGAQIYYTIDGSAPTEATGTLYTGPIPMSTTTTLRAAAFKAGFLATNVDTHTYIFIDHVLRQTGAGFPESWGSATADYEMDLDVVDSPLYSPTVQDDMLSIPTLSVVMAIGDIFGARGIYSNTGGSGVSWERPGSVELIYPEGVEGPSGDTGGFQVTCGVRIYGGVGRNAGFLKHTLRFLFKGIYGPTKLRYPLYGDSATDEFDTLIARAGFNNSWTGQQNGSAQYLRDEWMRRSQLAMGHASGHGTFVHMYINGLYWGLFNLVERPSAPFCASYYGGEKEEWDALNSSSPVDGDKDAWNTLQDIASSGVSSQAAYESIEEYLDVPNLIDYMIVNFYGGNADWDGHNWYAGRRRQPGAGYKFFSWDAERTLEGTSSNRTGVNSGDKPSGLYGALRSNAEFITLFGDHTHRHLFHGGALTPSVAAARYRELSDFINGGIVGESARWGDKARETPYTRDVEWARERDRLLNSYFPVRAGIIVDQFRSAGLYPDIDAPTFNRHGGLIQEGFEIFVGSDIGTVYYTVDGSDPRLPGGTVSASAIEGASGGTRTIQRLVESEAAVRVLVPTDSSLGTTWVDPDFDDSSWRVGTTGVGYETNSGYEDLINTDVIETFGVNPTVYMRIEFDVADGAFDIEALDELTLKMKYDDGFIAYLNGTRVASADAPGTPQWNSTSTGNHGDGAATVFQNFDLTDDKTLLQVGTNVLAIHGLNTSSGSSDLLFLPELEAIDIFGAFEGEGIVLETAGPLRARSKDGDEWSALNEAFFWFDIPLRITEIMYHPAASEVGSSFEADDYEFIELSNVGGSTLDLTGFRLAGAIDYDFSGGVTSLAPGEVLLVVEDAFAFVDRYPFLGATIAGEYSRNLGNSGDTILLEGPAGEPILDFGYSDTWYPLTDGTGYSLVVVDPDAPYDTWGEQTSWRPSNDIHGSPGVVEAASSGGFQIPGNVNQDFGLDISDAFNLLSRLFFQDARPLPCDGDSIQEGGNLLLADVNDSGVADLTDALNLLNYLFLNGVPPSLGLDCIRIEGCPDLCP